jgi:hypothetical protein
MTTRGRGRRTDLTRHLYALLDRDGKAMATLGRSLSEIRPLTVAADAIVDDLAREAERGARVVELLGPGRLLKRIRGPHIRFACTRGSP